MKHLLYTIILFISIPLAAQVNYHGLIGRLDAYKDKNRVILSWSINKGNSCVGIGIFRSIDGTEYQKIGEIQGICGSNDDDINYSFIDESPVKNAINYYVLELGFSGQTDPPIKLNFISLEGKTSIAIPNPASNTTQIHFENINNTKHVLNLYDSVGKWVYTQEDHTETFFLNLEDHTKISLVPFSLAERKFYYTIQDNQGQKVASGIIMHMGK